MDFRQGFDNCFVFLKEHSFVFSVGNEWGRAKEGTGAKECRLEGEDIATSIRDGVTLGVRGGCGRSGLGCPAPVLTVSLTGFVSRLTGCGM